MEREKGSITVFLSLILVLLFSFLLTTLEAARITGASAYVSMIAQVAGDSFLASYYSPLFEEYKLFGVDAGYKTAYISEQEIEERLLLPITYGLEGIKGGLLSFEDTIVSLQTYQTLLSKESFLNQVKEQMLLDGTRLAITKFFDLEVLSDVANIGEVYQRQEEVLQKTNTITQELLQLMELVDGICMTEQGLSLDKNGRLQLRDSFIKQLVSMSKEELSQLYDNEEVFQTVQQGIFSPKKIAIQIKQLVIEAENYKTQISNYDEELTNYKEQLSLLQEEINSVLEGEYKTELLERKKEIEEIRSEVSEKRDLLVEQLDLVLMDASEQYDNLQQKLNDIKGLLVEALKILERLEIKQAIVKIGVEDYEEFLMDKKEELSEELYQVFEQELITMKLYLGMEEQGYYVPVMRQSLQKNQKLLQEVSLSGFLENDLTRVNQEMGVIETRIGEYTVEGLWFTYGEIVVAQETGYSAIEAIQELVTEGLLSFVGVEEDMISNRELLGQELPSQMRDSESLTNELLLWMSSIISLLQEENIQELLEGVTEYALNTIALELYFHQHFGNYIEEQPYSKLLYEREYLLFGQLKDQENLFYMVLYLVAFRTLFTMIELIKTPQKMTQLQNFATAIAGITGLPLLISATKYALLLLWSVEEALIEVAALLQGKKFSMFQDSGGNLSLDEIFTFHPKVVAKKVKEISEVENGIGYQEYLMIFSLIQPIENKLYYAMDLIQENMRYRYRDSFRIRNIVTLIEFQTKTKLKKKYNTGLFSERAFELHWQQRYSY